MKRETDYVYFELPFCDVRCWYRIVKGYIKYGLKTKVPQGMYDSFMTAAGQEAAQLYNATHSMSRVADDGEIQRI